MTQVFSKKIEGLIQHCTYSEGLLPKHIGLSSGDEDCMNHRFFFSVFYLSSLVLLDFTFPDQFLSTRSCHPCRFFQNLSPSPSWIPSPPDGKDTDLFVLYVVIEYIALMFLMNSTIQIL